MTATPPTTPKRWRKGAWQKLLQGSPEGVPRKPRQNSSRQGGLGPKGLRKCLRVFLGLGLSLAALFSSACSTTNEAGLGIGRPALMIYTQARRLEAENLNEEAIKAYLNLQEGFPNTSLGNYAYFRLGELYRKSERWPEAELNYRMFVTAWPRHSLTPYGLYRLLEASNAQVPRGGFESLRAGRDVSHSRKILTDYTRFFLLYPKSGYLEFSAEFYGEAEQRLLNHEEVIGDYYLSRGEYVSAIGRYEHILRHHIAYPPSLAFMEKLRRAYLLNRQTVKAGEIAERIAGMASAASEKRGS